jgi:hypothetical protein
MKGMNTTLQKALAELEQLPADRRSTVVERFGELIARAKIDERLAASEARGGAIPEDAFFAEVKAEYEKLVPGTKFPHTPGG